MTNKINIAAACLLILIALTGPVSAGEPMVMADRVLVKKSERKLYLLRDGEIIRGYDIDLGGNPLGHKWREGDWRTPEGEYLLDYKLFESAYFLAIHISYPNAADRQRAKERGYFPGGKIMIHGLPTGRKEPERLIGTDWTNGCIAVNNEAMLEIWELVNENTPITILP